MPTHSPKPASRLTRGFTLIELVAALAATTITVAIGVSAYRTYSLRGEITVAVMHASAAQASVEHAFKANGEPPAGRTEARLPDQAEAERVPYVDAIDVVNGRIDIRLGNGADAAISGRVLSLTPYETVELAIVWVCGNAVPRLDLKPLGFSAGGAQSIQRATNIEARYLPSKCR